MKLFISSVPLLIILSLATQELGHVVVRVSDLEESVRFYRKVLNMRVTEEASYNGKKRTFLSSTDSHHQLVLVASVDTSALPLRDRIIQQIAFEVDHLEDLQAFYQSLKTSEVKPELKDNQISWSIYFYDPDSNYVEVYWDIRDQPFGQDKWNGQQEELTVERLMGK